MTNPTVAQALAVAGKIMASRYAGAMFAFAAGSIIRGEGTSFSDVDLVVIHERLDAAYRKSFVVDGMSVEAFVHDGETLAWFIDADIARGCPSILNMILEGVVLGPHPTRAEQLRSAVAERLSAGPPALERSRIDALRYAITDAVDDLRDERSSGEVVAIGATLYPLLVELALRGRASWCGTGKWAPRLLAAMDENLASRFDHAFNALFSSASCEPIIRLAEQEMQPHGGPLFAGYRLGAPATWRHPAPTNHANQG